MIAGAYHRPAGALGSKATGLDFWEVATYQEPSRAIVQSPPTLSRFPSAAERDLGCLFVAEERGEEEVGELG
jgi:hypothetical protein